MTLSTNQQRSWSDYPILGPYGIAITSLTTAGQAVLGADPARNGVIFHNPGTKNKRVMPVGSTLAGGAGGILIYPQEEFILLQSETSQFNVNVAWQAVTDDNADGSLTILDFTPNTPGAPEVIPTIRRLQQIAVDSPVGSQTTALGTGSVAFLAADPNRKGVVFNNPGTIAAAACPSNIAAAFGAGSIIILPGASKTILGNDRVRINCAWNAISQSGSGNSLTALGLYG